MLKLAFAALAVAVASVPFALRPAKDTPAPGAAPEAHRQDVVLREEMLERDPFRPFYRPRALAMPTPDPRLPAVGGTARIDGATQLRALVARGVSQGFGGLLYDNRDRDHSPLPRGLFPALGHIVYGPTLKKTNWDYGLAQRIVFPQPLIGNSSTALTAGPIRRSQVRHAMTTASGPAVAFAQYESNSLYIYPEHRDHDAVDLYPAQWPYTVSSQGSSGSDQPFMRALLMTLAAFPMETRAALQEAGLIAPALQMILRRNLDGVNTAADYLGPRAHPTVFEGADLRPGRMIAMAAAMTPREIPPMVRLRMETDPFAETAGLAGRSERLFDTPSAIARIWRAPDWSRDMVISAEETIAPGGVGPGEVGPGEVGPGEVGPGERALRFHWLLLRGDPARVDIRPLDEAGVRAQISLRWHDAYAAPQFRPGRGDARTTARVDIAVIAETPAGFSAPAFFSVSFPAHQQRRYESGPDGKMQLTFIDYDADGRNAVYDPVLHWTAPWRDVFRYDPSGFLLGWDRIEKGETTRFSATGRRADGATIQYAIPPGLRDRMVLRAIPQQE